MPAAPTSPYSAIAVPAAVWSAAVPGVAAAAYDPAGKHLYVAFPAEGRIARWSADGTELDAAWAEWPGVTAVRGGAGVLAAAGPDGVAAFDLKTGGRVPLPDGPSAAIAAVAVDAAGTVFAADAAADCVWAGGPAGWKVIVGGPGFPRPTGLLAVANLLFVASAGHPGTPGRVAAVNLKSGAVQAVTPKPCGALRGLDRDDKCYYVSLDESAAVVVRVSPVGEVTPLLLGAVACGPPTVVPDRRLLVIPRPDRVAAYSLDALRK